MSRDNPFPSKTQMVRVGNQQIYVAIQQGRSHRVPLLLINGIGANLEMLDPFVAALYDVSEAKATTIRFDVPGVGGSPNMKRPLWVRGVVTLIGKMLQQLDYPQVDVLGISWGGAVAQQMAWQLSSMCRRLILVATAPGIVGVPPRPKVALQLASPLRYFRPRRIGKVAAELYGGRFRTDPTLSAEYAEHVRAPGVLGYYGQMLALSGWSSLPFLGRLPQPTLILAGDDDPIIPLTNARMMAARIPKARLQVMKDSGHLFLFTQAEKTAELIEGFLVSADVAPYQLSV